MLPVISNLSLRRTGLGCALIAAAIVFAGLSAPASAQDATQQQEAPATLNQATGPDGKKLGSWIKL